MKDKAIIFFTRIPTLGKTKTRLEPFFKQGSMCKASDSFYKRYIQ